MLRYAILGSLTGAVLLGVFLGAALILRPTGGLRLFLGAATFLLAPPYVLLGASFPALFRNHAALYALATAANALLYGACSAWLFRTRGNRALFRLGPILALLAAWALFVVIHG